MNSYLTQTNEFICALCSMNSYLTHTYEFIPPLNPVLRVASVAPSPIRFATIL